MYRGNSWSNLLVQLLQKCDKFPLAFARRGGSVDRTRARIKPRKEVQGALADIFMFNPDWSARLRSQRRRFARPGLQTGFLIHAQHHFPDAQGAGVQGHNVLDLSGKGGIPWDLRRQPQMMAPGFQLVVGQNPLDCLRRNRLHHPVMDQLPGQFSAIPLGQRPPEYIGAFAGQFDDVQRHRRGKNGLAARTFCIVEPLDARGHKA